MATPEHRISKQYKSIVTNYDPKIQALVPHAKILEKDGKQFHMIPHRPSEAKLLNNLGYEVDSPILHHYKWRGTVPFDSQKVTAAMMVDNPRGYILNDMGTGKTRASLYATDYLLDMGEIRGVLIVAPLSTLTQVWEKEIFECFPHRRAVVLHGSKQKRIELLKGGYDYYIINTDGVKLLANELMQKKKIDAVIIDELATFRNARTARWKAMNTILKKVKRVWGMTGSPTPKAPTDAYGQIKLITPERVPKFFKSFQMETMIQITDFLWRPRSDANDIVWKAMQPAVRFTREDCIDLPPTTYSTREIPFSSEQTKAYKEMMDEFYTEMNGQEITAANAGVQAGKLIQIAAGFLYADGKAIDIPDGGRFSELCEILDETKNKVIVFTPFKYSTDSLAERLSKVYDVAKIHGDVSKAERDKIFNLFQNSASIKVIVAHPQCMSHGLTLTSADTIVWYAPLWDLEIYEQACARITRPGQKNNTHIVHFEGSKIEKRIYSVLSNRGDALKDLLKMFKEQR